MPITVNKRRPCLLLILIVIKEVDGRTVDKLCAACSYFQFKKNLRIATNKWQIRILNKAFHAYLFSLQYQYNRFI